MTLPKRIQRKRVKGWKAPEGTVHCTRPGKYGNPFAIGDIEPGCMCGACMMIDKKEVQGYYRQWVRGSLAHTAFGKDCPPPDLTPLLNAKYLSCFCKEDDPDCHLVVILEELGMMQND